MRSIAISFIAGAGLAGCTASLSEIRSPQYDDLSCPLIEAQADRVSRRAIEVAGVQDSKSPHDDVPRGNAAVVLWPIVFKGNAESSAELARLMHEFEALEQASLQKHCNIRFEHRAIAARQ